MRAGEKPINNLKQLANAICIDMYPIFREKPFCFFGHSMGGLLVFEVARELSRLMDAPKPFKIFIGKAIIHINCIGDCYFPSLPEEREDDSDSDSDSDNETPIWEKTDEKLKKRLSKLEGTPPELLENEELMKIMLPVIRADFQAVYQYKFQPDNTTPLNNIPITIFGAMKRKHAKMWKFKGWEKRTSSSDTIVRMLPSNHFDMIRDPHQILDVVQKDIARTMQWKN